MMDERIKLLAKNLVNYSCDVQPGEKVLIEYVGEPTKVLAKAIVREVIAAGGFPYLQFGDRSMLRETLMGATEESLKLQASWESERMKAMDCYIGFSGGGNVNELSDVPSEKMNLWQKHIFREVHGKIRINTTKWCASIS